MKGIKIRVAHEVDIDELEAVEIYNNTQKKKFVPADTILRIIESIDNGINKIMLFGETEDRRQP